MCFEPCGLGFLIKFYAGRAVVSAGLSGFIWSSGTQNKEGRMVPDPAHLNILRRFPPYRRGGYTLAGRDNQAIVGVLLQEGVCLLDQRPGPRAETLVHCFISRSW
jgi:hypothetical protein